MGDSGSDPRVRSWQTISLSRWMSRPRQQLRQITSSVATRGAPSLLLVGTVATLLLTADATAERAAIPTDTQNATAPIVRQARRGPAEDAGVVAVPALDQVADLACCPVGHAGPHALVEGTAIGASAGDSLLAYRVQAGDTISRIARGYSVSVSHLAALNKLVRPELIAIGQTLLVPRIVGAGSDQPIGKGMAADATPSAPLGTLAKGSVVAPGTDRPKPAPDPLLKLKASAPQPASEQAVAQAPTTGQVERPQPSARSGRAVESWQQDFLTAAGEAARAAQQATGVPASVTIAQAILESNWGRSTIGANNYFGIKAETKTGPAGVVWAATKEYTDKGWITIQAPFRAYENMAQSFTDHGQFFIENSRYAAALRNAGDPKLFARLIQAAGYATDPNYAQSLIRLMDKLDLYRYDLPVAATATANF